MTLVIATALAGCTTTQHEAQRERLDSARQRAALAPTRVRVANPSVTTTALATIRAAKRTAFIATVRNDGRDAVSDLPISIGYTRRDGSTVYLNAGAGRGYFQAHLPAIRAGRTLRWVYTSSRTLPRGARVFARVGLKPSVPYELTEMGVHIELRYHRAEGARTVAIALRNPTGVPQYQLQVYAYARAHGRYVAAGDATVPDLGAGAGSRLRLALVGTFTNTLHVEAVPTILQ
ncbi:MAG: hypothetical protein KGL15_08150 [Acidobacteriota bacterium]|nr:hypothetical protein [Acidobacteriota bacterium]